MGVIKIVLDPPENYLLLVLYYDYSLYVGGYTRSPLDPLRTGMMPPIIKSFSELPIEAVTAAIAKAINVSTKAEVQAITFSRETYNFSPMKNIRLTPVLINLKSEPSKEYKRIPISNLEMKASDGVIYDIMYKEFFKARSI